MTTEQFYDTFKALTRVREPFPWQKELFFRFVNGDIPSCCDLPTALGKTSIVAIWLIALSENPGKVPRRLVYVVNRRTDVFRDRLNPNLLAARSRPDLAQSKRAGHHFVTDATAFGLS